MLRNGTAGNVILLGGWYDGAARVKTTTAHLNTVAREAGTGLRPLIAADQEGGVVQQLRGAGYTRMPAARTLGQGTDAAITRSARTMAAELAGSGINVNLAPVADTVPTDVGTANEPIGKWGRQYSADPVRNASAVTAFIAGSHDGGMMTSVKHFPGLGRIRGNTDFASGDISDEQATTSDPYLQPFAAGIKGGTDLVMVGSARYPKLDATNQAMFSPAIVTGLLRTRLGWQGVVITDDVGSAKAVAAVGVGDRALRFIRAGGDIVLTARPSDIATMSKAIVTTMATDPAFAEQVTAAAQRVVALKAKYALAPCS